MQNSPEKLTFTQLVTKFHPLPSNHVSFSLCAEDSILTDGATAERGKLVRIFTVNLKTYAGVCILVGGVTHIGHVVIELLDKARYPDRPGWCLGVGLLRPSVRKLIHPACT